MNNHSYQPIQISNSVLSSFLASTYGWFSLALFISFGLSLVLAVTGVTQLIFSIPFVGIGIFIVQIVAVFFLSFTIQKLPTALSALIFIGYSMLMGITISAIYFMYDIPAIIASFGASAGMFAVMSVYGYVTKQDLTKFGNIALMGLVGIIIGSIINIFLASNVLFWGITYLGVAIFLVLIAWDTQKIKNMAVLIGDNTEGMQKLAIIGALNLYLDFINLFFFILRIFGGRD